MALCKDPALTYLNTLGYNVVRFPRAGIEPLDVLGRDRKSIERLGRLEQIWSSDVVVPKPKEPKDATGVSARKTGEFKLSIGLKILEDILSSIGANIPQLNVAYRNAKKFQFIFDRVKVVTIDPFAIGNFLSEGDLATDSPFVARYFQEEDTEAFVITEVLKSSSITVVAKTKEGTSVEVDIPAVNEAVGVKVDVGSSADRKSEVTYKGESLLTFGFKVFQICYVDGNWQVMALKDKDVVFLGDEGIQKPVILTPGMRLDFK